MLRRLTGFFKSSTALQPPKIKKIPHEITQFGEKRIDNYDYVRVENWEEVLKDPKTLSEDIRAVLEAENTYTDEYLKKSAALAGRIADELVSRVVPDDSSVPEKDGNWEYWEEYDYGADYPKHMRRRVGHAAGEVYFDEVKEAAGHDFFDVSTIAHSPDHKYVAYAYTTEGSESYTIKIRDLETGKELPETFTHTSGNVIWSEDSRSIFYVEKDDKFRNKHAKIHNLGEATDQDKVFYSEPNDGYNMGLSKSRSGKYIMIHSGDSETNQISFFESDSKDPQPKIFRPYEKGVLYNVSHHDSGVFYIRTNKDGASEYKIMTALEDNFSDDCWSEYVPHREDVTLEGIMVFKNHIVRLEKENVLQRIVVDDLKGNEYEINIADDQAYEIFVSGGFEYDTDKILYKYVTMADPGSWFEVDLNTHQKKLLKRTQLPNGHNPDEYVVERFDITARDGEKIPVTLLRHKSTKPGNNAPLHQYGYGSYGLDAPAGFSRNAISIVDRGAVYAVAHIRGGGDKGKKWHKAGKKQTKLNTFTDFIDVTEALIERGWGKKGDVSMEGRSAGGMLMGAVMNMRPDLYGSVIAGVAFVDVLNTISDGDLPLTPPEWEEWGDPINDRKAYDLIKSYSPYENIQKGKKYPMVIAPSGLTDPRVTYWEMTKWIAELRDKAKGGPFLLKMKMDGGHFGSTKRYDMVGERAPEYAFCIQHWIDKGYDMSLRVKYPEKNQDDPKPKTNTPK